MLNIFLQVVAIITIISKWIFANFFSVSAFIISTFTLFKNRKILNITWEPNIYPVFDSSIRGVDSNNNLNGSYDYVLRAVLYVVNPSPNDIAFYNLWAFNPDTDVSLGLITKNTSVLGSDVKKIIEFFGTTYSQLDIPEKKSGVFKSNSYTRFDLLIPITNFSKLEKINRVSFSFRLAKNSFLHNKPKCITYDIRGISAMRLKQPKRQDIETVYSELQTGNMSKL